MPPMVHEAIQVVQLGRLPTEVGPRSGGPSSPQCEPDGIEVGRAGDAGRDRQDRDRDQAGGPRDVVVDRRGDPRVLGRRGGQHGGGQRRDVDGQAQPVHDNASMMKVTGSSAAPEAIGLYPATTWSSTGSRNRPPASAAYTTKVTALAAENCRDRNRPSGSIGWGVLASTTRNNPNSTTPPASAPSTAGAVQPAEPALIRPKVSPVRPRVISAAPG